MESRIEIVDVDGNRLVEESFASMDEARDAKRKAGKAGCCMYRRVDLSQTDMIDELSEAIRLHSEQAERIRKYMETMNNNGIGRPCITNL